MTIKQMRIDSNLTQKQCAEYLNIPIRSYKLYEANDSNINAIKKDLKFVIDNTTGMTINEIKENQILIDSIMFRIIQIAENNGNLSDAFKKNHNDVPWVAIKGIRESYFDCVLKNYSFFQHDKTDSHYENGNRA